MDAVEELLLKFLGVRPLEDMKKEMENEVVVEAYPKEAASPIANFPKIKIVEGKKPEEDWKVPYLKVYGSLEGRLKFYGPLKGILTYGFGEVLVKASKSVGEKQSLPVPIKLTVFVYPGRPCYGVLKDTAEVVRKYSNLDVEFVHVDGGRRLAMLYELGVNKVPTYVVDNKVINVGPLSPEELEKELLKLAADKAFEIAKKELLREKSTSPSS